MVLASLTLSSLEMALSYSTAPGVNTG